MKDEQTKTRGKFHSKLGFILAAAGSAVGLGNIWRFPFEVGKHGGAAFLLMYLVFAFALCFPIMITEIAIGRKTNKNLVGAFKLLGFSRWSIIGKLGLISGVLILSFYNVVAGWVFGYFLEMLQGNFSIGQDFGGFVANWQRNGLYSMLFMGITAYIVSGGIKNGIERAAKILMPTLFILIIFLVVYAMTLPNALTGIKFYLIPDFSKINGAAVYTALGHSFFSLSLGMGALITYGSYVSRNENIVNSAMLITLADLGIAFLAGLMMFPFVFSQGIEPTGGAGLIFVALPGIFENLGSLGFVVGTLFFLLLSFAALTSTVSLLEVPVSYIIDEHAVPRKKAAWLSAGMIFAIGIPSMLANGSSTFFTNFTGYFGAANPVNFMDFITFIASDTFLPLGGLLLSCFAAYIWKKEQLNKELAVGNPGYLNSLVKDFINFTIRYLCPAILGMIFIFNVLDRFFGIHIIG